MRTVRAPTGLHDAPTLPQRLSLLLPNREPIGTEKAKAAGLGNVTVNELKVALTVLRRKRVDRGGPKPEAPFAAIGITTTA